MPITFQMRDRDNPAYSSAKPLYKSVTRTGHVYEIEGLGCVEIFGVRDFGATIDRNIRFVHNTQRDGKMPAPIIRLPGSERKQQYRVYTGIQLLNAHRLMWGKYDNRKGSTFNQRAFFEDLNRVWRSNTACVTEEGAIVKTALDPSEGINSRHWIVTA